MRTVRIDSYLTPDDLDKELRKDIMTGLAGEPKTLPAKWFYDERGSELFEEITRLEEYYPTRRERAVLAARADEIAAITKAATLLELGAGAGEKTRILLDALRRSGTLRTYIPVDVSGEFLRATAGNLAGEYEGLTVHGVVADHDRHLHLLPEGPRKLIAFLGGTVGNMVPAERLGFFGRLGSIMTPDDALLLGVDLVKDPGRLVRAYDDAAGVTAAFNRNVLNVINRGLDAGFDPGGFEHVAVWDPDNEWVEMRLRATAPVEVRIDALDMTVRFAAGEEMRTEVSAKFRRSRLEAELMAAGLAMVRWWTDPRGDFAVCLGRTADASA